MRGTPRVRSIRTFGFTGNQPALRTRCLVGSNCLYCPVDERPHHHDYRPTAVAWEPRAENRTPPDVVVRRPIRGIVTFAGEPSPCQWQVWRRSGPLAAAVTFASRDAASLWRLIASCSAIVTNAITPLGWSRTKERLARTQLEVKNKMRTILADFPSPERSDWGGWIEASVQRASRRVGSLNT
jgi:hypothetical protein